jgi:hypothetical protein
MQRAKLDFIKREFRISMIFILVVLAGKYLPALFSFSGQSRMYEQYYQEVLPFGFLDLLLVFFVIRLIVRIVIFFLRKHPN